MEHEEVKSYLNDWIANEVVRFAGMNDYPLHPFICLDSYVEGFKRAGVGVVLDKQKKEATFGFNLEVLGKKQYVPVYLKYSQILRGEGIVPMSTHSMLFSLAKLCLGAGFALDVSPDNIGPLSKNLEKISIAASTGMQSVWREYAQKYHENILITPEGIAPQLGERSNILPSIYRNIDWKELDELDEADFISESERRDFRENVTLFFFEELAKTKGFPLREVLPNVPPFLDPVNMFVEGSDIQWRNLEKFLV